MTIANKTHWIGVALLFISSMLLLVVTISAPIVSDIGLLRVMLTNASDIRHSSVSFGTFGFCVLDAGAHGLDHDWDYCTGVSIGYAPAQEMAIIDHTSFSEIASGTSDSLTNVFVLHPIECGIAFIAFLLSCGAGMVGSLAGALVAFLAWVLVLVSLAVDFSLLGIIHHHVNNDGSGNHAYFGAGIWCLLVSFVTLFFGMIIVFFTCCANRREKKRNRTVEKEQEAPYQRKKKFGLF